MRRILPHLSSIVVLFAVLSACSGDGDADETTTTTTVAPVTSLTTTEPTSTTAPTAGGGTATTSTTVAPLGGVDFPEYSIYDRIEGEAGDTLVVLIDPEYDSLSDIDLQNLLAEVVDMFPPVFEAYVVDDREAADLVLAESVDSAGQTVLDQHYLVRLEEGFRLVFTGPFSGAGTLILGS